VLSIPESVKLVKNGTLLPGGQDRAMLESNLSGLPAHRGELYRFSRTPGISPYPDGANAINSGGEAEGEGASPLPAPTSLDSYRHISAFDLQAELYQAFVDAGETKKGESYMKCGAEVYTLECESCGHQHIVQYNCRLRFCSRCASAKMNTLTEKYLPYLKTLEADRLRFVTLTIKNCDDLKKGVDRIRDCFTKLRHRKYYKSKLKGGLYSLQAEPDDGGKWNVHLHCIFYGGFLPQSRLSDDWLSITGDSFIVDIRRPGRPSDALRYVLRYVAKGIEPDDDQWTGDSLVEFVLALSDVRLVQAFGCFLGHVAKREPFACPECGYVLWRRLDPEGEIVFSPVDKLLREYRRSRSP